MTEPLDTAAMDRARRARDRRFDGRFFFAVNTTGIYCRPVCTATPARRRNVSFFTTAAEAEAAGFRPCLRCRPEAAPGSRAWRGREETVQRALALIEDGFLDSHGVSALAERLHVGTRQLNRLFDTHVGVAPLKVAGNRRRMLALQLLREGGLSMTDVALAAGYGSLRRFNDDIRTLYGVPPRALRGRSGRAVDVTVRLAYRPPYAWADLLRFLQQRAIPGVEDFSGPGYRRTVAFDDGATVGSLSVHHVPEQHALELTLEGIPPRHLGTTIARVRRLFDLDADPRAVADCLGADPLFADVLAEAPGLRVPGAWDAFEVAARAVVGQQVSVAGATTIMGRVVERLGEPSGLDAPLDRLFPSRGDFTVARLEKIGMPGARVASLCAIARAFAENPLLEDPLTPIADVEEALVAIRGIGPWTARYYAMRGPHDPDAFPEGDLVLQQVAGRATGTDRLAPRALAEMSEAWRPWRAYAVMYLWKMAALERGRQSGPDNKRGARRRAESTS